MGNYISTCVSCVEREQEWQTDVSKLKEADDAKTSAVKEQAAASSPVAELYGPELQAHINALLRASAADKRKKFAEGGPTEAETQELKDHTFAIVKSRADQMQSPRQGPCDNELQEHINGIMNARADGCMPSPVKTSPKDELQGQISAIVAGHATSLREQRMFCPSPSPAKSLTHEDLAYYANCVLSNAKERHTPARSRPSLHINCKDAEEDIQPRQLAFGDDDTSGEAPKDAPATTGTAPDGKPTEKCVDSAKVDARPFNINEIPSPTRNRAKQQNRIWDEMTQAEDAQVKVAEETKAPEVTQQKAAEKNKEQQPVEEQPLFLDVEEELAVFHDVEEEAAWPQEIVYAASVYAKSLREIEEQAEMDAMDKVCVDSFLDSVKACAWRDRVRTPMKGTNLYTKVIRPCRPAGTSVDVKDSNFRNLGTFLQFLESEGLLRLKPGLTDPVVMEINLAACRKYQYNPQGRVVKEAPHNAGCCCRRCTSATSTIAPSTVNITVTAVNPVNAFQYQ